MSTFDDDSDSPDDSYSDDGYFFDDKKCQKTIERLNSLREKKINWKVEDDRREFLRQLLPIIRNWKGPLPNLHDIFGRRKIDWLLIQYVRNNKFSKSTPLIEFIINSGYKDKPELDKDGKPRLRRTTALHWAARRNFPHSNIFRALFKIYNSFDANYIDGFGRTHFHVACEYGCDNVVTKFLELGQDPNCQIKKSKNGFTHPLHLALKNNRKKVAELLLKSGADPALIDKDALTPLHIICSTGDDDDFVKVFFTICDEKPQLVQLDACDKSGNTPLHLALRKGHKKVAEMLLRRGAKQNIANENGSTPLHTICSTGNDDDLLKVFFTICDEKHQLVQIDAQNKLGQSPLHRALHCGNKKVAEVLLRRGAKQNLADENGSTPLHIICEKKSDDGLAELFFKINDYKNQLVQVNVRDNKGRTPLHLALLRGFKFIVELLLRRGADSNAVDEDGETPLHMICYRAKDDNLLKLFFNINEEIKQSVQVNVVNKKSQTPLYLAVSLRLSNMAESLLRQGADPNVTDSTGYTPLHIIIKVGDMHFVKTFFKINDELNQSVQVDAVDESGHTPLWWAVERLRPDIVDFLLDRGAKLSSFIFPTEDHFDECLVYENKNNEDKLEIASRILAVVDSLEKRGYELGRRDALMVMKLFAKNEVFDESMTNLEDHWYAGEDFAIEANEIMVSPSLSLFDLIHHRSEETTKLLTYSDYWRFVNSSEWADLPDESREPCFAYLCEIMSRGFFRRWTLEFFLTLTNYRLPILCCDIVIKSLKNSDLLAICLAASDQVCDG